MSTAFAHEIRSHEVSAPTDHLKSPEPPGPLTPENIDTHPDCDILSPEQRANIKADLIADRERRAKRAERNRQNAQKSTGPKTPEGKARSSKNATKHGLTASYAHLPDEPDDLFLSFLKDLE